MAIFLTQPQFYRLLQRELPEGVYADGQASAFFTTADMASVAQVYASAATNLSRIYANYFPQETDESISQWVAKMFVGTSFDPTVTLQNQRDRVIAKIRKQPQIATWEVLTIAASYVPPGTFVQILPNNDSTGGWRLGASRLGKDTFLGLNDKWYEFVSTPDQWEPFLRGIMNWDPVTYASLISAQSQMYGYKLRIFDYTVTGTSYAQLIREISAAEPARSVHFVLQNVSLSGSGLNTVVPNVDQFSGVNCITQDTTSTTGYTGRI